MREVSARSLMLYIHGLKVVIYSLLCLDMSFLALNGEWIGDTYVTGFCFSSRRFCSHISV